MSTGARHQSTQVVSLGTGLHAGMEAGGRRRLAVKSMVWAAIIVTSTLPLIGVALGALFGG